VEREAPFEGEEVLSFICVTVLSPNHHRITTVLNPMNHSGASMGWVTTCAIVAAKITVTTGLVAFLNISPILITLP